MVGNPNLRQRIPARGQGSAKRGPAASAKLGLHAGTAKMVQSSAVGASFRQKETSSISKFAELLWAGLHLAVAFWVVDILTVEGEVAPTTLETITDTMVTLPRLFRVCFAALAFAQRGKWWLLVATGMVAAWYYDIFANVQLGVQYGFVVAFLLFLRISSAPAQSGYSRGLVLGLSVVAAYMAANWSTIFYPLADPILCPLMGTSSCNVIDDIVAHFEEIVSNQTDLLKIETFGAVLAGLSANCLAGSLGAIGQDGLAVGLGAMLYGQRTFAVSNNAEVIAAGLLFVSSSLLSKMPTALSAATASALMISVVWYQDVHLAGLDTHDTQHNRANECSEVLVHALAVLVIAASGDWCKQLSGWTKVFGILFVNAAIGCYAVVVLQSIALED